MEAGTHFEAERTERIARERREEARRRAESAARWLTFASAYLLLAGGMTLIWGIVALGNRSEFAEEGLVWSTLDTWGWVAIVVGALQVLAGLLLFRRQFGGQWLAGVLAVLGIFVHFLALGAYPIWSVIALVTNALVLWAVTAHGDEIE